MQNPIAQKLQRCVESVRARIDFVPQIAVILGSGLGDYAEHIDVRQTLSYHDIEGFPVSTVPGHKGRFVFGFVGDVPVVLMQGRVHYYEGYAMSDVVLPTRLMGKLGAQVLFLTNAAGGVNPTFAAGDFMLLRDQIADFVPSPLIGPNVEELGPRFPDMSEIYEKKTRRYSPARGGKARHPAKAGARICSLRGRISRRRRRCAWRVCSARTPSA